MMLFAHLTPPLIPAYGITFVAGLLVGTFIGFLVAGTRMGLRRSLVKREGKPSGCKTG